MPVTQGSNRHYLLLSHMQCFWVFNIVGPEAPFDWGDRWNARSSLALPLMPILIWALRKYSRGVGCWASQMKRPNSACPHWVGMWQRFEVAPRRTAENHIINPKGIKATCRLEPPQRESPFGVVSAESHLAPAGRELAYHPRWHLVCCEHLVKKK